jgi:CheY-like chemotaxis protein
MNLALNARDAMPAGGCIEVSTANVTLDAVQAREWIGAKAGDYVCLRVTDTGHGMDAETQARAFEPFFTTKDHGDASGLGLATVHGIVTQSGGYIRMMSRPAEGTAFAIYFPRSFEPVADSPGPRLPTGLAPAQPQVHAAAAAAGGASVETVLLVEDQKQLRRAVSTLLDRTGYRVLTTGGPEEALEVAEQHAVDLLLTDVSMPAMSGPELADRLRAINPGLRVLYMSGYASEALRQVDADAELHFIAKPFTPDELLKKLRHTLGSTS